MLSVVALVVIGSGCVTTMEARLYDLSDATVATATFEWDGSGRGPIRAVLPSGEVFQGEYVTIASGTTSWGNIFATVWTPSGSAIVITPSSSQSIENMQKGAAIATSNRGAVLECEYVTSVVGWFSIKGYGACKDNRGKMYKLMF